MNEDGNKQETMKLHMNSYLFHYLYKYIYKYAITKKIIEKCTIVAENQKGHFFFYLLSYGAEKLAYDRLPGNLSYARVLASYLKK